MTKSSRSKISPRQWQIRLRRQDRQGIPSIEGRVTQSLEVNKPRGVDTTSF